MSETLNKLTRLQHLVDLGTRTKSELDALDAKIQEVVNAGGQPNVIEEIWLNGVKQTVEEGKAVKLTVEQYDDTALAGRIDTNAQAIAAVKEDVDAFFKDADLTENAKDTLKEIQDYINSDASAASEMTASIQQNSQAITAVEGRVGTAEGKITTLEGKAHEHANKDVIDGITAEKVAGWDAAEGNAKAFAKEYADGLASNYDNKGAAASALTEAKEYADGLNTAMNARVVAIETDYLSSANIASSTEVAAALDGIFNA